jgi:uncharacterized protein YbaR (Trm112 family)/ubiquinone/menaquinone biosynthesis C-methylase UbiE
MLRIMPDPLLPLLQCPACRKAAPVPSAEGLQCPACARAFPVLDGIPWLFADAEAMVAEWRNRTALYLQEFQLQARRAEIDLAALDPGSAAARRVRRLAGAYVTHAAWVRELLAPLGSSERAMPHATQLAFDTELPHTQDLHSYHANVHRDWAWGDAENETSWEMVAPSLAETRGAVLVLGAGAGRLAYDVHRRGKHEATVALDRDPLLLAVGRRAAAGESVRLYEFPLAPLGADDAAVERVLRAPAPARAGLAFVAADAWRAPFAPQTFDAVITPWLLDVVDVPLPTVAAHVNRLLRIGGRWINFGSLAFPSARPALRWSADDVREIVTSSGFEAYDSQDRRVPYLQSPSSRHARLETVACFVARKKRRGAPLEERVRVPPWIADADAVVPRTPDLELQSTAARIRAVLLALLDGTRSVDDVARIVAEQGLLSESDARAATRALLAKLHAEAQSGALRVR